MGVKKYKNNFKFTEHPNDLELPLTWKKSKKIFVNSMSDLFHKDSQMEFIANCFNTMIKADWHMYQILTKRSHIMIEFSELFESYFGSKIPPHIWMGVSVENEDYIWRIDELRKVQCNTRFLSIEPLIGSVGKINLKGIDWVIIGGESGYGYREIKGEWILDIIKQCEKQKVAVFFKQWGGIRPKSNGRTINRRVYNEYPKIKEIKNMLKGIEFDEKEFAELCLQTKNSVTKKVIHA